MTALKEEVCDVFVVGGSASAVMQTGAVAAMANKPFWLQLVVQASRPRSPCILLPCSPTHMAGRELPPALRPSPHQAWIAVENGTASIPEGLVWALNWTKTRWRNTASSH